MPHPSARPHAFTCTLAAAAALLVTGCSIPPDPVFNTADIAPHASTPHNQPAPDSPSAPHSDTPSDTPSATATASPSDVATRDPVAAPATLTGWRLELPPVRGIAGLHVDLSPERRPALYFGQAHPPTRRATHTAAWATPTAREPDGDAARVSPRHAMLAFTSPSGADTCLVALIGHLGRNGRPAPGGFCLEIREAAAPATAQYAFEHPARQLTLTTAAGTPLPGGRNTPASPMLTDVRAWPAASRGASADPLTVVAHFTAARDNPLPSAPATVRALRAWFTAQPHDELITATPRRTEADTLDQAPPQATPQASRLLLRRRPAGQPTPTFVTVFEPATASRTSTTPNPTAIHTIHTRVVNENRTRVITVATATAVHTLVHHLGDTPYISPELSLDGRFAAITRTAEGRLIDAYLGDGNALVLPEHTLDAQSAGTRWAYARP